MTMTTNAPLSDPQYHALFTFRHALLHYLRWSERHVARAGLTEKQYLLLLAVRARGPRQAPSVRDVATALVIAPSTATELVDRITDLGLVQRRRDTHDQRVVRVTLTQRGRSIVESLSRAHVDELERIAQTLEITPVMLIRLSENFGNFLVE